jgi:hypothetical protein|tara:strand:- start:3232 stop:3471 length:240 start_codon:yes stop_codon:yes gene_type:complete
MEKNEILQMIDTLTESLDLLVQTQRKTQEFMNTQLEVNEMIINRIKRLDAQVNIIEHQEPSVVKKVFNAVTGDRNVDTR